jgi:TRAP-type mannitol/chloroaromatic compound transport system substrate-binding protein
VAQHPVYPGFHSMPLVEVSMNKATWDSMPSDLQAILEMSVRDFAHNMVAKLAAADTLAVAEANANPDITVHNWSAAERAKFRAIAQGEWSKVAARSAGAQKVYDVLTGYLVAQGMISE